MPTGCILAKLYPRVQARHEKKAHLALHVFGFQAESAKLHRNLDSDKIQPKAVGEAFYQSLLPGICAMRRP